jgi:hypothetical protein
MPYRSGGIALICISIALVGDACRRSPVVKDAELVAAYSFDEGTGDSVADGSGHHNTGKILSATWTDGKFGKALDFNGTDAWVRIEHSDSVNLTTAMTLEVWVNPVFLPRVGCVPTWTCSWMDVIHKDSDRYYIEASSNVNQTPEAGGVFESGKHVVFGPKLPLDSWSHLALTYDSATIRFYVNGEEVSRIEEDSPITTSNRPLFIGGDQSQGQYFHGRIDEVRIFNGPRTAEQIRSDMNTPVASSIPGKSTS